MQNNLTWHESHIKYPERCQLLNQNGCVIWFTGLSGSGKSTLACALEKQLFDDGFKTYHLDGDNMRHGLNSDLGFSDQDREENIRRVAEVAALFKDAGIITLVSFISPHQKMRDFARAKNENDSFVEVYVKAPLETCVERDVKGLYAKSKEQKIRDFTGISSDYEAPEAPDILIDTEKMSVTDSISMLHQEISKWLHGNKL